MDAANPWDWHLKPYGLTGSQDCHTWSDVLAMRIPDTTLMGLA